MADKRASNDEFFVQLASLIERVQQKGHGSIFLTQKRLYDTSNPSQPMSASLQDLEHTKSMAIIVRVSDGDTQSKDGVKSKTHIKLSTVVQPDALETFFTKYAETCKAGMQSLKKRDRSKRKRDKGKKKKTVQVQL